MGLNKILYKFISRYRLKLIKHNKFYEICKINVGIIVIRLVNFEPN